MTSFIVLLHLPWNKTQLLFFFLTTSQWRGWTNQTHQRQELHTSLHHSHKPQTYTFVIVCLVLVELTYLATSTTALPPLIMCDNVTLAKFASLIFYLMIVGQFWERGRETDNHVQGWLNDWCLHFLCSFSSNLLFFFYLAEEIREFARASVKLLYFLLHCFSYEDCPS